MLTYLKNFWWAGRNQARIAATLRRSTQRLDLQGRFVGDVTQHMKYLQDEVGRLNSQAEHDSLMLQAYANWCAAHGCPPTAKDLEHASGRKQ